jgi:hypothetical protein
VNSKSDCSSGGSYSMFVTRVLRIKCLCPLRGGATKQHHGTNQLVGELFRPVDEQPKLLPVLGRVNLGT